MRWRLASTRAGALAGAPGALDAREEDYVQSPQVIAGASWRDLSRVHVKWSQELDPSKAGAAVLPARQDIGRSTVLALRARAWMRATSSVASRPGEPLACRWKHQEVPHEMGHREAPKIDRIACPG